MCVRTFKKIWNGDIGSISLFLTNGIQLHRFMLIAN